MNKPVVDEAGAQLGQDAYVLQCELLAPNNPSAMFLVPCWLGKKFKVLSNPKSRVRL